MWGEEVVVVREVQARNCDMRLWGPTVAIGISAEEVKKEAVKLC